MNPRSFTIFTPALFVAAALGQATERAAFVANNGNVEGSITSFTFSPAGAPVFVSRTITGTAPSSSTPNAGTNPYAISLSPGGRWVATSHTTSSTTIERVMIHAVNADATLAFVGTFDTPDSPLDCAWLSDELLAVTLTNLSALNKVILYRFTPPAGANPATLVEVDREDAGGFTSYLAFRPPTPAGPAEGAFLYAGDTDAPSTIWMYRLTPTGTLDPLGGYATGLYPIGLGITNAGNRLYACSGISGGGNLVHGYAIESASGSLTPLPSSPYVSPNGSPSPKLAVASDDDAYLFVGHGSSSVIRSFAIDPGTGALTDTGFFFDVGIQGDLGDAAVLGDLVLVTDSFSTTGLYAFTIQPDGSFTMNGGLVSTQGVTPRGIAAWQPPEACYPDCTGDAALTVADFGCFQTRFVSGDPYADCNTDTALTVADFGCFQTKFVAGCP